MDTFYRFFSSLSQAMADQIGIDQIRRQWQALSPAYDLEQWQLPLPLWAQRPYEHDGNRAWAEIQREASQTARVPSLSIYLHIPFCTSKCGFCDSYSFKLGAGISTHVERYVDHLCYEMKLWSRQGNLASRPISTVHMGGGTPTFLDEASLRRLVSCCRECFSVSDGTEWALESTVESLTPSMTSCLHELGFRRLHVGIQSLQPEVRQTIGRRSSPSEALSAVEKHLGLGWVVSVDLICGLPGQTLPGWLEDIRSLLSIGTDGFSLYELLIYPQNRTWAQRHGLIERTHLPNYLLFQAGANMLAHHGYEKNLFNHWANERDQNIYFTHPTRGEDLIAIGTIADGAIGDYHYRHHRYAPYLRSLRTGSTGLEGGLRENRVERNTKPYVTAILSNRIPADMIQDVQSFSVEGGEILDRWKNHHLVEPDELGGVRLTTNGAWLAGNMVQELKDSAIAARP